MVRIAICDDVASEQEKLESLILRTELFESPTFCFFNSGSDLISSYDSGERYDIVFLDVEMPEVNGIETGKYISRFDSDAILIFVTNCPEYAIDAFDCNAFHYLLKNGEYEKFCSVISKAHERYKNLHKSILLSSKEGQISLNAGDVYYVECCRKHLYFYTVDKKYTTKGTLAQAYDMLSPFGFYQVHQGYIVNFEKVASITGNDIVLQNGKKVLISVRKKSEVLKAYSNYIARSI